MKHRNLKIQLINIENVHGLVLRVVNGRLEIDASAVPALRDQQEAFDARPEDELEKRESD